MTVQAGNDPVQVRLGLRSAIVLGVASGLGLVLFCWPLLVPVTAGVSTATAPYAFAALLPVVVLLVLAQLSDGGMDTRALAMLGVLSAINAALRPTLGAGTAGIESIFFTLVLAGWAFGPGFGFVLGCTSMLASALLTAGVGPWLPYQMLAAAWIGLGAGLLPGRRAASRRRARLADVVVLAGYGMLCAYGYGALLNLSFWPTLAATGGAGPAGLDYLPGAPAWENLRRFGLFTLVTSTAGWDTGRALTTATGIVVLGRPVLDVLRRAARRCHP